MTSREVDVRHEKGQTPLSDALERTRVQLAQKRTPAYGDALALCKRLERQLDAVQKMPAQETGDEDTALLFEAYAFGQFADDFDRSLPLAVRAALRRHLDKLLSASTPK